jgi:hypothetical protein
MSDRLRSDPALPFFAYEAADTDARVGCVGVGRRANRIGGMGGRGPRSPASILGVVPTCTDTGVETADATASLPRAAVVPYSGSRRVAPVPSPFLSGLGLAPSLLHRQSVGG